MATTSSTNGHGDGDDDASPTKEEQQQQQQQQQQPPRPIPHNALPCNSDNISFVELFRPKTIIATNATNATNDNSNDNDANNHNANQSNRRRRRRRAPLKKYHLFFAVLYSFQAHWIYSTVGVPYKEFLDKAEREGFEGELLCVILEF